MIYIDLQKLIDETESRTGAKVTLRDISEATSITTKTLSKLRNNPTERFWTDHMGKIIEFFFHVLRHSPQRPCDTNSELMKWVVSSLIQVYPDDGIFSELLPDMLKKGKDDTPVRPAYKWIYAEGIEKRGIIDLKDDKYKDFSKELEIYQNKEEEMNVLAVERLLSMYTEIPKK